MFQIRTRLSTAAIAATLLSTAAELGAEVEYIYFSTDNDGKVIRIDSDGSNPVTIINEPELDIETFTIDPLDGVVYWSGSSNQVGRGGDIYRTNLDGSMSTLFLEKDRIPAGANPGSPGTLLVDPLRRTLTIGGMDTHDILRSDLDGTNYEIAVNKFTDDAYIFGMDIDTARGILYWAACCPDSGPEGIMRLSIDSGERVDGPWAGLEVNPHGLAIDPLHDKLYWGRDTEIMRANLDATGFEEILSDLPRVDRVKLDVLGGKLYWMGGLDFIDGAPVRSLWRANLDGSEMETILEDVELADFYLVMKPIADSEFRILATRLTNDGIQLAWTGDADEHFEIEASRDPGRGWKTIRSDWPANPTGVTAFLIDPADLDGERFFRIRRKP